MQAQFSGAPAFFYQQYTYFYSGFDSAFGGELYKTDGVWELTVLGTLGIGEDTLSFVIFG